MAKGYDEHQKRQQALSLFGKDLARRSKSTCELTGESGVALKIYEIPPVKGDPDFANCLFLSENAIEQITSPKRIQANDWRGLRELIWSDLPGVQCMAYRMLTRLAQTEDWAQGVLDEAFLDEDIIAWAEKEPI